MAAPPSGGNDFANTGPCYGLPRTRLTPVASTEPRRYSTATSSSYQLPARISWGGGQPSEAVSFAVVGLGWAGTLSRSSLLLSALLVIHIIGGQ